MRKLPNLTTCPPGPINWGYKVPETGQEFRGVSSLHALMVRLQSHYRATGYEIPDDLQARIEAYICEHVPEYCGDAPREMPESAPSLAKQLNHTFHTAINCLKTLITHRAGSGERPTKELASARAAVCVQCPKNTAIEPCKACSMSTLNNVVKKLVGAGNTPHDGKLKFCAVCHCDLHAKVWTKHEAIWTHMPPGQKAQLPDQSKGDPVTCWIISEAK